jgi:diguanylate cyclase (GGDEF)-like protein
VVYAAISLVPVVLLGLLLAASYRAEAARRGVEEGRALATLVATTAVEPLLDGTDLRDGLPSTVDLALRRIATNAIADGTLERMRLRDLDGRIIFSDDALGEGTLDADEEALEAAQGTVEAHVTRLNGDSAATGNASELVVEVYRPLTGGPVGTRVGVLEIYLPYEPIRAEIARGLPALYRDLAVGLTGLYLVLAGLSYVTTSRVRQQARNNAYLAEHDQLTGLLNRRMFEEHVARIGTRHNRHAAVAVLDLDRFKEVNDTIGHHGGDEMIVRLGARLLAGLGPDSVVARLGGDEFGVILLGVLDEDEARSALTSLRTLVSEPLTIAGVPLNTEVSIGYVLSPQDGEGAELLQRADIAMYSAKAAHTGVVRYDVRHDHYDGDRLALVGELRGALQADELVLHYQPTLHLHDDEVRTVEALVRWNHPRHGLLYPDAFLPAAEQTSLIDTLTDWVLAAALAQLGRWDALGSSVDVAVNVSARNLTSPGFTERVLAAVTASGLPPSRLLLEVTETALFTDVERAMTELRRLNAAGIRISLDDFGQGQTSLSYLAQLPLTELKIDRAFVSSMLTDPSNGAIVRSVIELAHNLGILVVAEGVEDPSTLDALRGLRCDVAQGYVLARPMPAAALPAWLIEHAPAFRGLRLQA